MKEQLLKSWQEYKTPVNVTYQYGDNQVALKMLIVEALAFWRFVFNNVAWKNSNLAPVEWVKRRDLLSVFLDHSNVFIRTIVRIESMPTAVWRKVFWKYNIDLMSFESFLRRLTRDQIIAIRDNYDDLSNNEIPQAFGKWDRLWGVSLEKLFAEGWDYETRYANKGAMSYNLLGIDFGFNAYPDGVNNDTKVIEVSPLRFLSIKNHANDFVVQQESGGRYWWLYKTARSNYVWFPDNYVFLKTHICPGFWYTILVHLLFWVISPLAFSSLAGTIIHKSFHATSWWFIVPTGIVGVITPLWLIIAAIKYSLNGIVDYIYETFIESDNPIKKFYKKHEKPINILGNAVAAVVIVFLVFLLIKFILWVYPFVIEFFKFAWDVAVFVVKLFFIMATVLVEVFGIAKCVSVLAAAGIYFGYKIYFRKKHGYASKFTKQPFIFQLALLAFIAATVMDLFVTYPGLLPKIWAVLMSSVKYVALLITTFFVGIWEYFVMLGPLLALTAIMPFAFFGIIAAFAFMDEEKQQKAFDLLEKAILPLSYGVWAAFAGFFVFSLLGFGHSGAKTKISISILFGAAVLLSLNRFVAWLSNPRVREAREFAKDGNSSWGLKGFIERDMLLQNRWFQSLDRSSKDRALGGALRIIRDFFSPFHFEDDDEWKWRKAHGILVSRMTPEILESIKQHQGVISKYGKELAFLIFEKMAEGLTFDQAVAAAQKALLDEKAAEERREVFWKKTKKTFKVIFFPIILIWKLFGLIFAGIEKGIEYVKTLRRLYVLFNERCPYVTQKRVLKLD